MIIASPFNPIFFPEKRSDGAPCRYEQVFAVGEEIVLELFSDGSADAYLVSEEDGTRARIGFAQADMGGCRAHIAKLAPEEGLYRVSIGGVGTSEPFRVTSCQQELALTTLIQYTNDGNGRRKDAVFAFGGERVVFQLRAPGGFKPSNYTFSVDNEQFETSDCDIVELYGKESTQKKFTLGGADGAPIWFGEMLNRLLCCDYVYFDGLRYARKGSSVPEIAVLQEGVDAFVFNVNLQRINHSFPNITDLLYG